MLNKYLRRLVARPPKVRGHYSKQPDGDFLDSELGTFQRSADDPESRRYERTIELAGHTGVLLSFYESDELANELANLRVVVAATALHDARYRKFAAIDVREFHELLYKGATVTPKAFAKRMKLFWIQTMLAADPNLGANLWYTCDDLIPNARVCVTLDQRGLYYSGGVG